MKRKWFRDEEDGTFYRNVPMNLADRKKFINFVLPGRRRLLDAEWNEVWEQGVVRVDALPKGDSVVEAMPFRLAYPDHPALWMLDEELS